MAKLNRDQTEVNARIVYWGIEGCGKTTNLHAVYGKLRPDHRGELQEIPTRIDPSVSYEVLPIELGEIAGLRTRIQIIAPPSRPEQAPTRKQLLDQVDGIVLVVDSQSERIEENIESFGELCEALGAYGRSLEDLPVVIQYNKCDLADPLAIEDLHRKLDLGSAAVFETVATEGTGVLQTLSTISKRVIRSLRDPGAELATEEPASEAGPPAERPAPAEPLTGEEEEPEEVPSGWTDGPERIESAILEEPDHPEAEQIDSSARQAETLLEPSWELVTGEIDRPQGVRLGPDLSIASVGEATRVGDRTVRVPIVLGDAEGQTTTLVLTIQLDPLIDENRD